MIIISLFEDENEKPHTIPEVPLGPDVVSSLTRSRRRLPKFPTRDEDEEDADRGE